MKNFRRFAIYYAPQAGAFSERASAWLGWDLLIGQAVERQGPEGLMAPQAELTRAPGNYGFHGTIKAPFRLGEEGAIARLQARISDLAARLKPVELPGLRLQRLGGFLALLPEGDQSELLELGAQVVQGLDELRAPLTAHELARRRPENLSPRQRDLLGLWGYPYVMEEFRFHLTLTDGMEEAAAERLAGLLGAWFAPVLPRPFVVDDLCLCGEDAEGRFHLISRHRLAG